MQLTCFFWGGGGLTLPTHTLISAIKIKPVINEIAPFEQSQNKALCLQTLLLSIVLPPNLHLVSNYRLHSYSDVAFNWTELNQRNLDSTQQDTVHAKQRGTFSDQTTQTNKTLWMGGLEERN